MGKRAATLAALTAAGAIAVGGYAAVNTGAGPLPDPERCTATVDQHTVVLSIEQAQNASIIAAVAERRGLPARAVSIALAAAFQESKLRNLSSGDRDSLGLFQQRPSQGWGSPKQVRNPYYATNAFYDALVSVPGYQQMPLFEAAQAVQHSAYPLAYAVHVLDGRTLASALSGWSPAAFSCVVHGLYVGSQHAAADRTARREEAVRRAVSRSFGPLQITVAGPPSAAHRGKGILVHVSTGPRNPDSQRRAWVLADYLVANAERLGIRSVSVGRFVWTAGSRSEQGWRPLPATRRERPASVGVAVLI
jgi:hypothetical protein